MQTKKKPLSKKHHYLPVFYLNGFTDQQGSFFVYDKLTDKIYKSKPKNVFYEKDRNSIHDFKGNKHDAVEKLYAAIDDKFVGCVKNIVKYNNERKSPFENGDVGELILFISMLKSRVPGSDSEVLEVVKNSSPKELNFEITEDEKPLSEEKMQVLENSEIFKWTKILSLHTLPIFSKTINEITLGQKLLYNDSYHLMVGDRPVLEMNGSVKELNEFICPIGKNVVSFYVKGEPKEITSSQALYQLLDIAQIHNAERFVCCTNEARLKVLSNVYKIFKATGSDNLIIPELFKGFRG